MFDGYSCGPNSGRGVVVSIDSGKRVIYYGQTGTLDSSATETWNGGLGTIFNVEPGSRVLESRLVTGELVGTYHVQVKADCFTELFMNPTPVGN